MDFMFYRYAVFPRSRKLRNTEFYFIFGRTLNHSG